MRKSIVALAFGLTFLAVTAVPASADTDLLDIPAHRHFVAAENGELIEVGPRLCDNPALQKAFNQFHYNVHHAATPAGPLPTTQGPQDGAPGLHNGYGAELTARACSFTP